MKAIDDIEPKDNVELILRDAAGKVKRTVTSHNLVVTKGAEGIADQLLASPAIGKPTHMAVGKKSSPTAPAAGNTALEEELDRNALASKTRSGKVVTYKANWAAGDGTGALTEAGIFNAASSGDLYNRVTFGTLTKEAEDTLEIIWTTTVG